MLFLLFAHVAVGVCTGLWWRIVGMLPASILCIAEVVVLVMLTDLPPAEIVLWTPALIAALKLSHLAALGISQLKVDAPRGRWQTLLGA